MAGREVNDMKIAKIGFAFGMLLLLVLSACETRSTTVVNDEDDLDRVAVVDTDPDVTVVNDRDPVVVERVWWRPSTWSSSTTTRTTTTNTRTVEPEPEPAPEPVTGEESTTETTTETTTTA